MDDSPQGYALRRLNPFLGVMQVVESARVRALSSDGVSWQLQVLADKPQHTWGCLDPAPSVQQYFRFGDWNADEGMSRVPINPLLDVGAMLAAAEELVGRLQRVTPELPFPLRDHLELWLLDTGDQPLALLASTTRSDYCAEIQAREWHAVDPFVSDFRSATLGGSGLPGAKASSTRGHADALEALLQAHAEQPAAVQWFERDARHDGTGLAGMGPARLRGRRLDAGAFPPLGFRTTWQDPVCAAAFHDYTSWLAPWLLTLQDLSDAQRRELESAARSQPLQIERYHRLYPQVLQPELIDAARVEARLRRAAS